MNEIPLSYLGLFRFVCPEQACDLEMELTDLKCGSALDVTAVDLMDFWDTQVSGETGQRNPQRGEQILISVCASGMAYVI